MAFKLTHIFFLRGKENKFVNTSWHKIHHCIFLAAHIFFNNWRCSVYIYLVLFSVFWIGILLLRQCIILNIGQHIFYIILSSILLLLHFSPTVVGFRIDFGACSWNLRVFYLLQSGMDNKEWNSKVKVNKIPLKKQVYLFMLTKLLGVFIAGERKTTAGLDELSLNKSSSARAQPLHVFLMLLPNCQVLTLGIFHMHVFR